MFRKSAKDTQLGLFSAAGTVLKGRTRDYYQDEHAWHNLFRKQVYARIDEDTFSVLYSENTGAPNASIRVMISMMVIKEACGWSDAQLFESCRYNLLVRSALGLFNIDSELPTESTYYLFRKRISDYEKLTGQNLIEKAFAAVTKGQAVEFEVSGRSIRMDSKLLGSNIAWYSRYELIHESLRLYCKELTSLQIGKELDTEIKAVLKSEANKIVYRHSKDELISKLQQLGILIDRLLQTPALPLTTHYQTLCRVFKEQFTIDGQQLVIPRPKEEITSESVQSPHDTDCHYRNKGGNQVKGYSINVAESCDKDELHLISHVEVQPVSAPDNHYLQPALEHSQQILNGKAENVHADGAYHDPDNQDYCNQNDINLYLHAIQGAKGRYELSINEEGELNVTDTESREIIPATKIKNKKNQDRWRIKTNNGFRYFSQQEIDTCLIRKKIENTPLEKLHIRNNVEATIFQLGYHYPNSKSRYRGLTKHRMWANIRSLWINFVRILKYIKQICQRTTVLAKSAAQNFVLELNFALNFLFQSIISFFLTRWLRKPIFSNF